MNALLYWTVRLLIGALQLLPLRLLARIGRLGGALAWRIDARHRKVVLDNLTAAIRPLEHCRNPHTSMCHQSE